MFCQNTQHETEEISESQIPSNNHPINQHEVESQTEHLFHYNPLPQQNGNNPSYVSNPNNPERKIRNANPSTVSFLNKNLNNQLNHPSKQKQSNKIQERNQHISSLLTVVIAFSQRIERLKQKICGYSVQTFSPVRFFNVLDLNEKGYVDTNDVWRFINNQNVREKDILILFKKVNGQHSQKDGTRLSYFGYLNLIKPYFNERMAKDILSRDTFERNQKKNYGSKEHLEEVMDPTQEAVLLLFQELLLLHCIATTEHEQAKELLLSEHLLNTNEIKQIMSLEENSVGLMAADGKTRLTRARKPLLALIYDFISANSQYAVEQSEMRYILSFMGIHEFNLQSDKYLKLLFLPTNYSADLLREIQRRKQQFDDEQNILSKQQQNYMNAFLTKENMFNHGDAGTLTNFLQQKIANRTFHNDNRGGSGTDANPIDGMMGMVGSSTAKTNFLNFVHPESITRPPQYTAKPIADPSPRVAEEHPGLQVNISDKNISNRYNQSNGGQNASFLPIQKSMRQAAKNPVRMVRENNASSYADNENYYNPSMNKSNASLSNNRSVSFLGQFMRESNIRRNLSPNQQQLQHRVLVNPPKNNGKVSQMQESGYQNRIDNHLNRSIISNSNSDSAFEVIDYGYDSKRNSRSAKDSYVFPSGSKRLNAVNANTVASSRPQPLYTIKEQNPSKEFRSNRKNSKSPSRAQEHQILQRSQHNYLNSASMSESNFIGPNDVSRPIRAGVNVGNNSSVQGGILDEFLKK